MKNWNFLFGKSIRICLIMVCLLCFDNLGAQKITYDYDASGNRIKRSIIKTRSLAMDTTLNNMAVDSTENGADDISSADEENILKVKVYPNPTSGVFEVELANLTEGQNVQLYIYSHTGHLVKTVSRLQNRQSVDISNQPSGIYLLRITVDDKVVTNKIIKQ